MSAPRTSKWYIEYSSPHLGHMHGITEILASFQTKFQKMDIVRSEGFGTCLILDDKMQATSVDEFIYHETLVHPVMLTHPEPKSVLVIGGAEGATLREVLKHRSVEKAVMVDIDDQVIEQCKKHLPSWHQGAFDDKRSKVISTDARKYLEETDEIFDVIITDLSEPVEEGPAYLLYTREFYQIAMGRLSPYGTLSLQAGTASIPYLLNFSAVYQTLNSVFPVVAPYQASIPSFGLPWGFAIASKNQDPRQFSESLVDQKIRERISSPLSFYDGTTHKGIFGIPKHVRRELDSSNIIIEDNHPLFTYH
ncbi:MAG: polyamine aminopropyltransferase [Leptospirales bacterium]